MGTVINADVAISAQNVSDGEWEELLLQHCNAYCAAVL